MEVCTFPAVSACPEKKTDLIGMGEESINDRAKSCVETDAQGNSVLTGDGGNNNDGDFTCTGLEVFLIE